MLNKMQNEDKNSNPLISRACLVEGYNIEAPRRYSISPEDMELLDSDKDVKFFEQLSKAGS